MEPGRALRILLVEDNPINQQLARKLLEKRGHSVVLAVNGKECLRVLSTESFDLVLMDIQMPEMDGLEAAGHIRASEQGTTRHLPIIALTAHSQPADREKCLLSSMDEYITKPLRIEVLLAAMASVVAPFDEPRPSGSAGASAP